MHQAPGASCGILSVLVLSLVLFMQSLYTLYNLKCFIYLCPLIFLLLLSVTVIESNVVPYIKNNINYIKVIGSRYKQAVCH